jgi:4-hydroxy-2-oxoheptanedioate aldolase
MKIRFLDLLAGAEPVIGTWSQFASAEIIDVIASSGFRFTIIDTEHGFFGLETGELLIRACDAGAISPLFRVPRNDALMIAKALDAGASAIVVPKIQTAEEAAAAVRAAKYFPEGERGACSCTRASDHLTLDWRGFAKTANAETGIIPLIETPRGVENFPQILAVKGIVAVLLGPFDLSVAMGREGDFTHPEVIEVLEAMARQAVAAEIPVIMPVFSPALDQAREQIGHWRARGVRLFTIGTDKLLFADHCRRYVAGLR